MSLLDTLLIITHGPTIQKYDSVCGSGKLKLYIHTIMFCFVSSLNVPILNTK